MKKSRKPEAGEVTLSGRRSVVGEPWSVIHGRFTVYGPRFTDHGQS